MPRKKSAPTPEAPPIYTIRKLAVVLDSDLARLYGVSTGRLNEAVRRNADKFPSDFRFQLTSQEFADLRSQNAILNDGEEVGLGSQNAISSSRRGAHRKYLPYVFTEHGALMAATVLRSPEAVQMSLYLVRAFVRMRDEMLTSNAILKRLAEIDRKLLEHDVVLQDLISRLLPLLDAPSGEDTPKPKRRMGYHANKG